MLVTLLMLVIAGALILAGCQATRAGYESAPYKVVRSDGKFRGAGLSGVDGGGNADGAAAGTGRGSFRRLFRFITGRERGQAEDRDDHAGLHVRQRHERDDGVRAAGEAGRRRKCPSRRMAR